MSTTGIEWTDRTWNPTTGCDRVSPGCDHCYALTMAARLKAMGQPRYQHDGDPRTSGPGFGLTVHDDALTTPLRWRAPQRVFVNSMSDLLHPRVPDEFLAQVFAVMASTPRHTYQILTKRHARLRSLLSSEAFAVQVCGQAENLGGYHCGLPLPNVHLGVSAEDQHWAELRIPALTGAGIAVRFLSCEPLLGPVDLSAWLGIEHAGGTLDWVIIGGESGPGARPMRLDWARSLIGQCAAACVPVFVKQLGSVWARQHGADPKGGDWAHWPAQLRIRQFPTTPGAA